MSETISEHQPADERSDAQVHDKWRRPFAGLIFLRTTAIFIDLTLVVIALQFVSAVYALSLNFSAPIGFDPQLTTGPAIAWFLAYFLAFETLGRGSPGKRLTRITIACIPGSRLCWFRRLARSIIFFALPAIVTELSAKLTGKAMDAESIVSGLSVVTAIGVFFAAIELFLIIASRGTQGLHDVLAGTLVLRFGNATDWYGVSCARRRLVAVAAGSLVIAFTSWLSVKWVGFRWGIPFAAQTGFPASFGHQDQRIQPATEIFGPPTDFTFVARPNAQGMEHQISFVAAPESLSKTLDSLGIRGIARHILSKELKGMAVFSGNIHATLYLCEENALSAGYDVVPTEFAGPHRFISFVFFSAPHFSRP